MFYMHERLISLHRCTLCWGHKNGHSKMFCFLSHKTMPQMSQVLRERAIGMLTSGLSTRAVARKCSNVILSIIISLQRRFGELCCMCNRFQNHRPRITTPAQDLHIRLRPATWTNCQKPSQGSLSAYSVVLTRVLT